MSRVRQCWSAKESIIRKKKLMELENAMFKQDGHHSGLTPLRFMKGDLSPRKKTVEDLERGWSNSYKGDIAKQTQLEALPCFGFKDKAMRGDLFKNEFEKTKKGEKLGEGWVANFREQKTKELDEVYGKDSPETKSTDKRPEAAWVGNHKEARTGKTRQSRVTLAQLQKTRIQKRMESTQKSGKTTQRSSASTFRGPRSPRERSDRFLDSAWVRSPRGIETELLWMERSYGDISDGYTHALGHCQQNEKDLNADMGWISTRSPRREASSIPRAKTAEEIIKEKEDKFRENSWLNSYQHGQTRELLGLRSYAIGDYLSKKENGDDLSWAANCRAKVKSLTKSAVQCERDQGDIQTRNAT